MTSTKVGTCIAVAALLGALELGAAAPDAQTSAREQLTKGQALWSQRLSKSALAALEAATRDTSTAAEAYETIGRIYMFKGWQQEGIFPGWHDETEYRERAVAAFKASLEADPSRASAAEALKQAQAFAASTTAIPPAPPPPEVKALDATIESFRGVADRPAAELDTILEQRTTLQADPAPYFTAAQIMLDRGDYPRAVSFANRGAAAGDRFIAENEGAYKMAGKSAGSRARTRAAALDIAGAAALAQGKLAEAGAQLNEADRVSRGQDFAVQFHLGELARARKDVDGARERYLNALALGGGPAPLRERATRALAAMQSAEPAAGFDAWLKEEIDRRRAERRDAAVKSVLDRQLPPLAISGLDGKVVNVRDLRGKVLLLNFFSSWCGACRAELPHLKKVYEKYQSDAGVAFLLVSLDSDPKRLQRYLGEQKFAMPIARASQADAQKAMGFDDVPATFYVDRSGVVRYETRGVESHGDSAARVTWFIEELKR